jgi:hypothetical protein
MERKLIPLLLACFAVGAQAACQGNACERQARAAKAAGLLGGTLGTCASKTYPASGALSPVSGGARRLRLRR